MLVIVLGTVLHTSLEWRDNFYSESVQEVEQTKLLRNMTPEEASESHERV